MDEFRVETPVSPRFGSIVRVRVMVPLGQAERSLLVRVQATKRIERPRFNGHSSVIVLHEETREIGIRADEEAAGMDFELPSLEAIQFVTDVPSPVRWLARLLGIRETTPVLRIEATLDKRNTHWEGTLAEPKERAA